MAMYSPVFTPWMATTRSPTGMRLNRAVEGKVSVCHHAVRQSISATLSLLFRSLKKLSCVFLFFRVSTKEILFSFMMKKLLPYRKMSVPALPSPQLACPYHSEEFGRQNGIKLQLYFYYKSLTRLDSGKKNHLWLFSRNRI